MRYFKLTSVIVVSVIVIILVILISTFTARNTLITHMAEDMLAPYHAELTCIDATIDEQNFSLIINEACITLPEATFKVLDARIDWQFSEQIDESTSQKSWFSLSIDPSSIQATVNTLHIQSLAEITLNNAPKTPPYLLKNLPADIKQQMQSMSALLTKIGLDYVNSLTINTIDYRPFIATQSTQQLRRYQGQFSVSQSNIAFKLARIDEAHNESIQQFIALNIDTLNDNLVADLNLNLLEAKLFLSQHRSVLNDTALSHLFSEAAIETWSLRGNLHSQINWQQLTLNNTLNNFAVNTLANSFNVNGAIKVSTQLDDQTLAFTFAEGNQLNFSSQPDLLMPYLHSQKIPTEIIDAIEENKFNQLSISPNGLTTIDLFNEHILVSSLNIHSKAPKVPLHAPATFNAFLNDISIDYTQNNLSQPLVIQFNEAFYDLNTSLKIPALAHHTEQAANVQAKGKLTRKPNNLTSKKQHKEHLSNTHWVSNVTSATINIPAIKLPFNAKTDDYETLTTQTLSTQTLTTQSLTTSKSTPQRKITAENIQTTLNGDIVFFPVSTPATAITQAKETEKVAKFQMALTSQTQITALTIPDYIKLKSLNLMTSFKGTPANIHIESTLLADKVNVANMVLTGDLYSPDISLFAKEVLLTDLLALQPNLPFNISLIDGKVFYKITGENIDYNEIQSTPLSLEISVEELTGEIEKTWLQSLNWQQNFVIENGLIATKPFNNTQINASNLSIEKIEAAIPITDFSTETQMQSNDAGFTLNLANIQGKTLDGSFSIPSVQWPLKAGHSANVQLTSISLEKLLELDKKQGIVVTGNISGQLPIFYDGKYFIIKQAELHNITDGVIQVYNNPAVEELKASQAELDLAFTALENLHYHHLASEVSMGDDGYMILDTTINGRNPDLDNDVNLNLNLDYDWLGLLESLTITDKFENQVVEKLPQK